MKNTCSWITSDDSPAGIPIFSYGALLALSTLCGWLLSRRIAARRDDFSVGQPRDYDARASYTIYDDEARVFEFKRVAYDIDSAAQKIFGAKLERNFGNRLFIGV